MEKLYKLPAKHTNKPMKKTRKIKRATEQVKDRATSLWENRKGEFLNSSSELSYGYATSGSLVKNKIVFEPLLLPEKKLNKALSKCKKFKLYSSLNNPWQFLCIVTPK